MRIKDIYIKGFKGIESLRLEFHRKVIVISGPNGSGKSSLFEAIKYALTGELDESIKEYVNWNQPDQPFLIRVNGTHESKDFFIELSGLKTSTKELLISGDSTKYKNSAASKKLDEFLGCSLINYSSISSQHESTQILKQKPSDRLNNFKEILHLTPLQEIADYFKERLSEYEQQITSNRIQMDLIRNKKYPFQEIEIIDMDPHLYRKELEILEGQEGDYNLYIQKKNQYVRELDSYTIYVQTKEKHEQLISSKKLELANIIIPNIPTEFDPSILIAKTKELQTAESLLSSYEKELLSYKRNLERKLKLENEIARLKTENDAIVLTRLPKCLFTQQNLTDLYSNIQQFKSKIQDLVETKENKHCVTCEQPYEHGEHLQLLESRIRTYEKQLKDSESKYAEVQKVLDDYALKQEEYQKKCTIKKELQLKIDSLEEELKNYHSLQEPQCLIDKGILDNLRKEIQDQEKIRIEVQENKKKVEEALRLRSKIESEIQSSEAVLGSLVPLPCPTEPTPCLPPDKTRMDFLRKELHLYEERIQNQQKILELNKRLEEEKKEDELKIEQLISMNEQLEEKITLDKVSRKIIEKDFPTFLIENGTRIIQQKMNEFFQNTGGTYSVFFKKDGNSIEFFYSPDGDIFKPVSMASGFEKQLIALSFRIALMKLQNIGILLLDEIDSDSEVQNSLSLYETLMRQEFEQLICITHKPETIEFLENNYDAQVVRFEKGSFIRG